MVCLYFDCCSQTQREPVVMTQTQEVMQEDYFAAVNEVIIETLEDIA